VVEEVDQDVYVGYLIAGTTKQMSGLFDTTTDLIAIQSVNCESCTGEKYDILPRVESGKANYTSDDYVTTSYGDFTL